MQDVAPVVGVGVGVELDPPQTTLFVAESYLHEVSVVVVVVVVVVVGEVVVPGPQTTFPEAISYLQDCPSPPGDGDCPPPDVGVGV